MNDIIERVQKLHVTKDDILVIYSNTISEEETANLFEMYKDSLLTISEAKAIVICPSKVTSIDIMNNMYLMNEYQHLSILADSECTCPEGSFDSDNLCLRCKASHILNDVSEIIHEGYNELKGD